jgi:hypothetical protein
MTAVAAAALLSKAGRMNGCAAIFDVPYSIKCRQGTRLKPIAARACWRRKVR